MRLTRQVLVITLTVVNAFGSSHVLAESAPAKIARSLRGAHVKPPKPLAPRFTAKVEPTMRMKQFNHVVYPPNHGFKGVPKDVSLRPGTVIDRFGSPRGTFAAPAGTPKAMRSLVPSTTTPRYGAYVVKKPIPVRAGEAGAYFGQPGGGIQYRFAQTLRHLPVSVEHLLINGYLRHATVRDLFRVSACGGW